MENYKRLTFHSVCALDIVSDFSFYNPTPKYVVTVITKYHAVVSVDTFSENIYSSVHYVFQSSDNAKTYIIVFSLTAGVWLFAAVPFVAVVKDLTEINFW